MSNLQVKKLWNEAHQNVLDQLEYEMPKDPTMVPKERETAFQHVAVLYIKYLNVFRKLENAKHALQNVYDQIAHPQKRRLLKDVLISVIGRVIELKHKLVEIDFSDFFNFTDILLDLKLTPDDLNVPIPRFILEEREKDLENRKLLLDTLGAKELQFGDQVPIFPEIKVADAVRMIQIAERARQGRLRAKYMREIKYAIRDAQREKDLDGGDDENEVNQAALRIQRVFKGYKARKIAKLRYQEELMFLGMAPTPRDPRLNPGMKAEANRARRKVIQLQHEEEYQAALVNTKEKITKVEGPDMKEAIQDSFRQWYMEYRRVNGKFPEFPADRAWQQSGFQFSMSEDDNKGDGTGGGAETEGEDGATSGKETEKASSAKKSGSAKSKDGKSKAGSAKKGGKAAAKGKGKGKGGKGKKDDDDEEEPLFKLDDSKYLPPLTSACGTYGTKWLTKDEAENFAQKHDQEIIKNDKRKEVEAEIKKEVFEILKEELKNLKLAVDRDKNSKSRKGKKGKKGKSAKGKKGKKGGKKGKKAWGKKGKKGKKEKDLTANRTMDSLMEELIQAGILQKYRPTNITDCKGEFDLLATSNSKAPVIEPTLAEMRRVLTEYCILPLGFPKPNDVSNITSVLLFGARGVGKTMMVNAVASESGAFFFNITPKNTMGQYVGKPNVTRMIHMVFKVAKANPPAVIYLDNIEMVFAKKIPKDDLSDPKRIKKDLLKQIKALKAEDRVIFMGTSFKPWEGEAKALLPIFDKTLLVPKPNYASRFMIWREFIHRKAPSSLKNINFSLLTRMSQGLSAGSIHLVVERVLTERRLKLDWFEKTPLMKKRAATLIAPEEEDDPKKKKGAKGGKEKKKK
ncbi:Dynein regulatory complex protein 11 [Irineochytrium annulatum]|nr:Dynein regulatory complex protein 11 [Irineochytrium annulatum]